MNKTIIKGRLTRDPELKTSQSGTEYCAFSVAVDRRYVKEKDTKITDFFDVRAFGNTGVAVSKFFCKGKEILIEGRMESNRAEKDGVKVTYWTLILESFEFCGSKGESSAPAPTVDAQSGMEQVNTEELPF